MLKRHNFVNRVCLLTNFCFLEYDWKFADAQGFKKIATDEQKRIVADVLGHNLTQLMLNVNDSYETRSNS